jgi:NitT/TauT family transport system ATP-binding protein
VAEVGNIARADKQSAPPGGADTERRILAVQQLRQVYGAGTPGAREAIRDVSFSVQHGEFICVVGPSGAGKTTLLRSLSGLLPPTSGQVLFENQPLTRVPDRLSVVFQDYSRSLFPWLSVQSNVAIPLKVAKVDRAERAPRIQEVLTAVGLPDVGKQYPWQLSGGMQQRVALARSLADQPELLLMDEPFASVDAQTRFDLEDLILRVRSDYDMTIVLVTHDIDEALYLGDRVVVLSGSPSTVRKIIEVPFGQPRSQATTRSSQEFGELRTELLSLLTGH